VPPSKTGAHLQSLKPSHQSGPPVLAKGGNTAVTITAATFLGRICSPRDIDAQSFQNAGHNLFGEWRVSDAIACAVKPYNQAISDKIISAHAIKFDEIF